MNTTDNSSCELAGCLASISLSIWFVCASVVVVVAAAVALARTSGNSRSLTEVDVRDGGREWAWSGLARANFWNMRANKYL